MIENGGHYPHAQSADDVAAAIIPFLGRCAARDESAEVRRAV
jgi:hypothetical protein